MNANLEIGRTQFWEILRNGERFEGEITPEPADWQNRLAAGYIGYCGLTVADRRFIREQCDALSDYFEMLYRKSVLHAALKSSRYGVASL